MKVAIGYEVVEGPWGGGNRFVSALSKELLNNGHAVVHSLLADDIDVILMIDPRSRISNIPFGAGEILRYLQQRNPRAVVVHRINECDERKGTHTVNFRLRLANYVADHTVFVGSWLRELNVWSQAEDHETSTILNGADPMIFHSRGYRVWDGKEPLKLVTHHWGGNWMKGFDVYQKIDAMLELPEWKDLIQFSYIGNTPSGFQFKNAQLLAPLDSEPLAEELRRHHVYVTASINEPGGNHQNEGALCGLPLLYRNSGSMPEYCNGFGLMFDGLEDFENKLQQMLIEYPTWQARINDYPHKLEHTIGKYICVLSDLHTRRAEITAKRRLWRNPMFFLMNQVGI